MSAADRKPAVVIGTFDGVHRGHRRVIDALRETGLRSTVLTFEPHPRLVLGYDVQLLTTFDRLRAPAKTLALMPDYDHQW